MLAEMKKLAMCISLSNLYFIEVWDRLIYDRSPLLFFGSYSTADYITVILNVLVMGIILWLVLKLIERYPKLRLGGIIIFGIVTVIVIKSFSSFILRAGLYYIFSLPEGINDDYESLMVNGLIFIIIFFTMFLFCIAVINRHKLIRFIPTILLIFFPFALITLSQATWIIIENNQSSGVKSQPAKFSGIDSNQRVLWLIFDDMDQRITFEDRPETVELPELDRFLEKAVYATQAYPPHYSTHISIPSLTTGRLATGIESSTLYDIKLFFTDTDKPVSWSTQPNIFQKAKQMGFRTAAGGWVLPYHKVFEDCLDISIPSTRLWETPFIDRMYYNAIDILPFVSYRTRRAAVDHQNILEQSKDVIVKPEINLTFIHFMPPHEPWIYDRKRDEYNYVVISGFIPEPEKYFDNLVLVDRTLGLLRGKMENEDLWDQTTVLISSDHWWKRSHHYDGLTDYRVPFMLKLPGQTKPFVFDTSFNTTLSHDLLLSILQGDLTTPEDAVEWLEKNHSRIDIPDYK